MAGKINYQRQLEGIISRIPSDFQGRTPRLLLHACCAPCSSYCLEYLSQYFDITVLYYNPNISPAEEYLKRVAEVRRLVGEMPMKNPVTMVETTYSPTLFYQAVKGLEQEPEGGRRCEVCFRLRLDEAARYAKAGGFDFFTTTLTISPLKNAPLLNAIGDEMAQKYGVAFLPSDFKKKEGYKRSIALSAQYGLYRQNFCGCVFSKR